MNRNETNSRIARGSIRVNTYDALDDRRWSAARGERRTRSCRPLPPLSAPPRTPPSPGPFIVLGSGS
ncbi:unnamed protein product, partial [Brenthis ino]